MTDSYFSKAEFAKRLKEAREKAKISQHVLAEEVGISVPSISAYENGTKAPNLETAFNIAAALNVSLDWICGNAGMSKKMTASEFLEAISLANIYLKPEGIYISDTKILDSDSEITGGPMPAVHVTFYGDAITAFFDSFKAVKNLYEKKDITDDMYKTFVSSLIAQYAEHITWGESDPCPISQENA